jgi:futalosine hydrolase
MEIARERFQRYGALAENMEGSAVAQACFRFDVPFLECRGISNIVGDRCKERWRIGEAMAHCHSVILNWLD